MDGKVQFNWKFFNWKISNSIILIESLFVRTLYCLVPFSGLMAIEAALRPSSWYGIGPWEAHSSSFISWRPENDLDPMPPLSRHCGWRSSGGRWLKSHSTRYKHDDQTGCAPLSMWRSELPNSLTPQLRKSEDFAEVFVCGFLELQS